MTTAIILGLITGLLFVVSIWIADWIIDRAERPNRDFIGEGSHGDCRTSALLNTQIHAGSIIGEGE
jgi:hypothetical protein